MTLWSLSLEVILLAKKQKKERNHKKDREKEKGKIRAPYNR